MTGSFLIMESLGRFPKKDGTLYVDNGLWLGLHSEGRSDWCITELHTGLKCHKEKLTKDEAIAKIKSEDFRQFVIDMVSDKKFDDARRACEEAYTNRLDKELAKTFVRVFL